MKHLFWLIALLIITMPVIAQDGTVSIENNPIGEVDVTHVTLTRTADNSLSLTIYGNPVSCQPVVVEQSRYTATTHPDMTQGTLIDIQLTTAPVADGTVCNFFAPFSHTVTLEGNFETDQSYLLTINNFTAWVYLVRRGQVIMDMQLQQVDVGDTELIGWLNNDVFVSDVVWGASMERHVITISGTLPDGCIGTMTSYIKQDSVNPALVHVTVSRILPLAVDCPAVMTAFNMMIETDIVQTADVIIDIGGNLYQNRTQDAVVEPMPVMMRPIVIESVNISGTDGNYQVQVIGTKNGDCGVPLQEIVGENGAVSVIDIFDIVPELAPCTLNLIPYDNTFTVRHMPIVVNGEVYFADDTSNQLPDEGDTMQFDTVIENVEVVVLESFPMQLQLIVTGYQADGCDFPIQVVQHRDENTVTVHIFREMPAEMMCPSVIVSYNETIALEGGFTGGTVTIHVNDQTVTVEL